MTKTIGNPLSWTAAVFGRGSRHIGDGAGELASADTAPIELRSLEIADLGIALRKGLADFQALRTDVMFIVLIYPAAGILLTLFALNREALPLLFPMISGFALLGPLAAVGLYEMSRRRERGKTTGWGDAFGVLGSPSLVPILALGFYLVAIFVAWMLCAFWIYALTLGPEPPQSITGFLGDIFTTGAGWMMLILGCAVGFVFAALVLAVTVISFPLLIDRRVGLPNAVGASVRLSLQNPITIATWGALVVVLLGAGIVTLFVGLIFVLPVLGHATWHLYRQAVVPVPAA